MADVPEDLFETEKEQHVFKGHIDVDENIIAELPQGTRVISAVGHGYSFWTRTARVDTILADGTPHKFFVKVAPGAGGKGMMQGEFQSMSAVYAVTPDFAPKPIAWGTMKADSNLHFFVCEYVDMHEELPEMHAFSEKLAEMHRNSVSPTGKFGFPVTTYNGSLPQLNDWTDTWEEFFANGLKHMLKLEQSARGHSQRLEDLTGPLFEKVIPRLLRPLETDGRSIKPCLIHGDLWYGNAATDAVTGAPLAFDAASCYGHNEYDVRTMRPQRFKFGRPYLDCYHTYFPKSAPVEDHDDRINLYALRSHCHESILYPGNPRYRKILIEEIEKLVRAYPEGWKQ